MRVLCLLLAAVWLGTTVGHAAAGPPTVTYRTPAPCCAPTLEGTR